MKAICGLMAGLALASAVYGQGTPLPYTKIQFLDGNGRPLASGQLCSFLAGTSTPRATFSDYTLTTANPQCVPLDSSGRASIWMDGNVVYRIQLKDSTGSIIWTQDGVPGSGSGILTTGTLWSQSGNTVYNASGNRVCIGATACTSALATLDVAGATSGGTGLFRLDDTANNPSINLYGSGTPLGSIGADPTGLRLRAGDGTNQATISPGNFTVRNQGSAGISQLNVQASPTQSTGRLMQFLASGGTTMTFVDSLGRIQTTDTNNDSIFATNGGVGGSFVTATDSLFLIAEAQPSDRSAAGQARIYLDNTLPMQLYASINGAAYAPIGSGSGGSGSFSAITSGTNILPSAMVVGNGSTLTINGTGTITATSIGTASASTTVPASTAANQVLVTSAANVGTWSPAVPDCPDSAKHLNFDATAHSFSCGTTGGTAGSVAFSGITGASTNAGQGIMSVGVGSSITPLGIAPPTITGTGVINANAFNGSKAPVSGSVWKSNSSLQPDVALASDIVALFSGCSGTQYLGADGACHAAAGGGASLTANQTFTGVNTFSDGNNTGLTVVNNSFASTLFLQTLGLGVSLSATAGGEFNTSSGAFYITPTKLYPGSDNAIALGDPTHRMSNVYSAAATIGGTTIGSSVLSGAFIASGSIAGLHYASSAGTPGLSGGSGCSLVSGSNDTRGAISCTGTGTPTLTFATTFGSAPFCTSGNPNGTSGVISASTSSVTFNVGQSGIGSFRTDYICMQ